MTREVQSDVVRIGLAGCGTVGGAFVRLLDESRESIRSRYGVQLELSRILVRDVDREREVPVPRSLFTNDRSRFLDDDIDIVVEAIGGCGAAKEIAETSLGRGRRFVTANKELIARDGADLASLARRNSAALDFGASVGGSAPVITLLRDLLGTTTPRSVRGILNGTSNFILTEIERGATLERALRTAQLKGLAEADSSRDLNGADVAAKLAIVTWLSFGIAPSQVDVKRFGINTLTPKLVEAAASLDGRARLIGECRTISSSGVSATVEPVVFPAHHAFARTELEDNRIEVDLGWTAPVTVSGPGAGGVPTATALLADLLNSAPRANDRPDSAAKFRCVEDGRAHRWLVAANDGWQVFTATRAELRTRTERTNVSVARLELPVVGGDAS